MRISSPWKGAPRKTVLVFLLAVFFTFAAIGVTNDIFNMGRQSAARLAILAALSGLFAVGYAISGVTLRRRFWVASLPLFLVQLSLSALVSNQLPNSPQPPETAEMFRLHGRLTFDAVATIVAVCLGYSGFVYVSISEAKRYGHTRAEMTLLESEMIAARHVQEVILPNQAEPLLGFHVECVYRPARQVGGDFFQILPASNGLLIVFGDVSGKGLPAAMLVSMLVGSIRATADFSSEPTFLLRKLHEHLLGRCSDGFSTALAAYISSTGTVSIANAGQLPPYCNGQEIELGGALPLGISGGGDFKAVQFDLLPGGRLTFVSDGVVEAQGRDGELFGFDRTKRLSMNSAEEIAEAAIKFGQSDDITVLTVERSIA